jgi:putative IMPACT (imprinted ancient) family translation regulator
MSEQIKTLQEANEFKFKEKGSLFIGYALPAEKEDEAIEILSEIKKENYDATHNCYAYQLFDGNPSSILMTANQTELLE